MELKGCDNYNAVMMGAVIMAGDLACALSQTTFAREHEDLLR